MPKAKRQRVVCISNGNHNAEKHSQYVPKNTDMNIDLTKAVKSVGRSNEDLRLEGGRIKILPDFWKIMKDPDKYGRNCFEKNLEHIKDRNNPADRLIVAYLQRTCDMGCVQHCFILCGNFIVDNSNGRYKNVPMDYYLEAHNILNWVEIAHPKTLNITGEDLRSVGLTMEVEYACKGKKREQLKPRKDGVWDLAVKRLMDDLAK